ncbi:SigE family RNA polymerase sigma factor [Streptomyces resistomycificus]|uniref:SigE family RNA polymerase sigma factor n=1 Tax=Streptomyces resistomycificus TaxID=67356 RepID=UPI0004AB2E7D|nr:SigE family RNA polymerase sigma factor [Streptomyces resistomycificus]
MNAERLDSFREFVDTRSSALLKTAVLLCGGDQHAGEDLLQTALVKAAGRWQRIDEPEAVSVAEPPEAGTGVADAAAAAELRLVMREALSRLTARQRTVLVLRYFEDLPEADVARLLGCTVGTVRSTTHRSLARLRSLAPELAALGPADAERRSAPDYAPVEVRP